MTEPLESSTIALNTGDVLFREGEAGRAAYVIESGSIEISADRSGQRMVLANLGRGDLFGEMALVDQFARTATATALESTTLIAIERDELQQKLERADPVLDLLLRVIVHRFRSTLGDLIERVSTSGDDFETTFGSYDHSLQEARARALHNVQVARELHRALEAEELCLYYQPIVDSQSARIAGFEALMRWQHPERGLLGPGSFIGVAEDTGVIRQMGRWALEEAQNALPRLQRFADPGAPPLFMSVNLSTRQIEDPLETEALCELLRTARVDPGLIKLEITESLLITDPERAESALRTLKQTGATLAIDDFGTGYSSLSYLHRFPLDTLKIDRAFVNSMERSANSSKIVLAIVGLARALDMGTVAEGVETAGQHARLRELGCTYLQGYLFSRPVREFEAARLLALGGAPVAAPGDAAPHGSFCLEVQDE